MASGPIVSAAGILAAAAAKQAAPIQYKEDDLSYDVGLLAAFDAHPLDPSAFASNSEAALLALATENTQLLIRKVFE